MIAEKRVSTRCGVRYYNKTAASRSPGEKLRRAMPVNPRPVYLSRDHSVRIRSTFSIHTIELRLKFFVGQDYELLFLLKRTLNSSRWNRLRREIELIFSAQDRISLVKSIISRLAPNWFHRRHCLRVSAT